MKKSMLSVAVSTALLSSVTTVASGEYLAGDFHNHTTCSDGSTSVKTLTRKSLTFLDWFIQVGHSGATSRDCRLDDFYYYSFASEFSPNIWENTLEDPATEIKGDLTTREQRNGAIVQQMWKWQGLQEYSVDAVVSEREAPGNENKEAFLGLEWVVPGHEHTSAAISTGQYDATPNADAMAQFEYCFGRNSDDTSGGGGQGWTCELSEQGNQTIIDLFTGRPEEGPADYNATLVGGINIDDAGDHVKSTAGVLWMQENFPGESIAAQAHVERQGAFITEDDEGYNIEHMRDWNNVAPEVAVGFESQPGHQGQYNRGSYNAGRPTAGLWTFGGTGCYAAAEAAQPGFNFDGTPLTVADFGEAGAYPEIDDDEDPAKVTLCRPGVRTMWDAMLSEGRQFWFFASSDWHNRGMFGPLDFETTNDFWPGEYQEHFAWIDPESTADPGKKIIDGLVSGNSFAVQGQLIDDLVFTVCYRRECATMGETLTVPPRARVRVTVRATDPKGENRSPYKFDNPSLLQIGVNQPLNEPRLAHVDLIKGVVGDRVPPRLADGTRNPEYYNQLAPETTVLEKNWVAGVDFTDNETRRVKVMSTSLSVERDSYFRIRGSNIPPGTPNERDIDGNPLPDNLTDNIPCADPACPPHIEGTLDADVEAWADLWFYANPIFVDVQEADTDS